MATVTKKYQVCIPKKIREKVGIKPGDRLEFETRKNEIIIRRKSNTSVLDKYIGYLRSRRKTDDVISDLRGE